MTTNVNGDFRETELGARPAEWEVTTLGELLDRNVLLARNGFPCGNHNDRGMGIPHLRPFNIDDSGRIALNTIKYIQTNADITKYFLEQGDVIFNNTNSEELVGKTAYWQNEGKFVLSNHMTILRIMQDGILDGLYLSKFLHKRWEDGYFTGICRRHVNQASISLARLHQIAIALPPLPEQHAIARVLSTIQRAIETQDKLIAAARELKKSLMRQLFMQGLDANGAVKETEIGVMPEHWELLELGAVADIVYGAQAAVANLKDKNSGIPILTNINITNDGDLDLTTLRYYPVPANRRERLVLQKGDLLFNWRSGSQEHVGKTALFNLDGEYTFASFILRFRVNEKVQNAFLHFYLQYLKAQKFFAQKRDQSSVNSVFNASLAQKIPVMLPPLSEQREIARMLSTADKKIETEENRQTALEGLFKTMLQQLMTGQIRVGDYAIQESHDEGRT